MKRLWSDRRGNVLAITAAALPLVVGAAGLATDTIQWVTWKRELQRAADSAALAGAFAKAQDPTATANTAVTTDLAHNNHTPATMLTGYPQIAYPTANGWNYAVQVTLAVQKKLGFSSLFLSQPPIITTSATAALVDDGIYCAFALRKDATKPAITISGSSQTKLGCKAVSNSQHQPSVEPNGNAYRFETTGIAGAATLPDSIIGTNKADLDPYHVPMPDPFKDKYPTDIPSSAQPCSKQVKANDLNLTPGCYKEFKFAGNQTYTLDPGVYYLDSTNFDAQGTNLIKGTGVTIILTGSTPGSVTINGSSTVQLSAPTTGAYEKMLFIQAANATESNVNKINGESASLFDGAMYFPNGQVQFNGSSGAITKCVMVVALELDFSGNSNLQNDTSGCVANKTEKGKTVRLVA